MTTVTGKFKTRIAAEAAAQALIQRGYPAHLIHVSADDEFGCALTEPPTPTHLEWLNSIASYLHPHALIGALIGGLTLGGIAAFYFSLHYLHLAWVFAMFGVGTYVGLLSGTMFPPKKTNPPIKNSALSSAPAVVKVCTTPHQSSILGNDLERAGATQIDKNYTV